MDGERRFPFLSRRGLLILGFLKVCSVGWSAPLGWESVDGDYGGS